MGEKKINGISDQRKAHLMRTWTDAGMKAEKVRICMNVNDFFLTPHYSFTTIRKGELWDEEFTQS